MIKLVLTLHLLAAVFLIGPMAITPMVGMRAIRRHDTRGVHDAGRTTMLYTLLSLIVFAFGLATVAVSKGKWSFGAVWITISMTLYVIALVLALTAVVPGLRHAARLLDDSVVTPPTPLDPSPTAPGIDPGTAAPEPAGTDTATIAVEARRKLDSTYGRVAASSGVVALLLVIIVILMVTRPGASSH